MGSWWLPGEPEQKWNGTLSWKPDGRTQLELVGIVRTATGSSENMGVGPVLVLGRSHEGKFYTCHHTFFAGFTGGFHNDSFRTSRLDVQEIFVGKHFENESDIRFGRVRFAYSNLHEWYWGKSAMVPESVPNEEGHFDGVVTRVTHQRRQIWATTTSDGATIKNDYNYNSHHTENPTPQITFTHTDGILITAQKLSELSQTFLGPEIQFRTLVNLIADYPLQLATAKAALTTDGQSDIEIYHILLRPRQERQDHDPQLSPVQYEHLGASKFEQVLRTWFQIYEQAKTVVHLYLSDRLSGSLELDSTFLTVMQALEAYHHLFYPSHVYMDPENFKRTVADTIIKAIPENLDRSLKDKLKGMLRYGYEYSLAKKLEEIVNELPDGKLKNEVQAGGFLRRSVETRNYLVHRDPEAKANAFADHDLYIAGCIWQAVIYALLLGRAGLPPSDINRADGVMRWKRGTLQTIG